MDACSIPRTIRARDAAGDAYLLALRRLHQNGLYDSRIAEVLSDLPERDILLMERHKLWTRQNYEACMRNGAGEPWTRRRVEIARRRLGLPGHRPKRSHRESDSLKRRREVWAILFARSEGWGHLVGQKELIDTRFNQCFSPEYIAAEVNWPLELLLGFCLEPWDVLWPHEALVLSSLDLFGPQTLPALRGSVAGLARHRGFLKAPHLEEVGHTRWNGRHYLLLPRLCERGLIQTPRRRPTMGRWFPVWELSPWMRRRPTNAYAGAEQMLSGLARLA